MRDWIIKYRISLLLFTFTLTYLALSLFDKDLFVKFYWFWGFSLVLALFIMSFSKEYPKAFNVAIIGFSKTGKTTLLTVLINEILIGKFKNLRVMLKGDSTIVKVQENMKKLRDGIPVGATTDETKFAYRTNITVGKTFLNRRNYKVEFGDFPGERSSEFSKPTSSWLKNTEFFNWAIEADAYIFAIDVSICFIPEAYFPYSLNDVCMHYRTAWMQITDNRINEIKKLRRSPLLLVFTKSDIFYSTYKNNPNSFDNELFNKSRIARINYIQENNLFDNLLKYSGMTEQPVIPTNLMEELKVDFDRLYMNLLRTIVESDFNELISFFLSENKNTKLVFTSAFLNEENSSKLGFKNILSHLIPSE